MKKYILICCISFLFHSCEKDDFCTQNTVTPKLILRFYDTKDKTKTKKVERLSIIATSKKDSLYVNQSVDSIAVPLNSSTKETVYTLKMNSVDGAKTNNKTATLTVKYTTEEEYVSRSCGFKVIFNNITIAGTPWIESFSTSSIKSINNQSNAHVKIYH